MSTLISINEAADRLSVSPKTVRRMIARGQLDARRIGTRLIRVSVASVDTLGRPLAGTVAA